MQTVMDDAALLRDLALAREHVIATGWFSYSGPNPAMDDLVVALDLPPSVIVIETRLEDADAVSDPIGFAACANRGASHPQGVSPAPVTATPEPEPEQFDALMLERIVRMAHRRQLRVHHSGPEVRLVSPDGAVRYSGPVEQIYQALKIDTLAKMPTRGDQLRQRLASAAVWGVWSLVEDHDGRYTIIRDDVRMFSGTLEEMEMVAASRILNSTPDYGYSLGHLE